MAVRWVRSDPRRAPPPLRERIDTCPMDRCGVMVRHSLMVWVSGRLMCVKCGEERINAFILEQSKKGGECGRGYKPDTIN